MSFDSYDEYRVRAVPCPHCGAASGEPCRTDKGRITTTHTPRKAIVYPRFRKRRGARPKRHDAPELKCAACGATPASHPGHAPFHAFDPPACNVCLSQVWREKHG